MIEAWIAAPVLFCAAMLAQLVSIIVYARVTPFEVALSWSGVLDKVCWIFIGMSGVAAMIAVLK